QGRQGQALYSSLLRATRHEARGTPHDRAVRDASAGARQVSPGTPRALGGTENTRRLIPRGWSDSEVRRSRSRLIAVTSRKTGLDARSPRGTRSPTTPDEENRARRGRWKASAAGGRIDAFLGRAPRPLPEIELPGTVEHPA